jgi:hypothetical protein
MPPTARTPAKPGADRRAEAFIAGGGSPREAVAPASGKAVVNSRWDAELLRQIDQAARKQGISRTAWLHVAAAEKLAR